MLKQAAGGNKIIFAVVLVTLGIAFRTIWHPGDNIEFVTAASLLSGAYLGAGWGAIVPLAVMMITDRILGNSSIFIFTWSAYVVIGIAGYLSHLGGLRSKSKIPGALFLGIAAGLWFYLWTNFGVWLLDSFGMYPKTLSGLLQAYWYGLPFLKMNLLGNLVFVPLSFFIVEKAKSLQPGFWKKLVF